MVNTVYLLVYLLVLFVKGHSKIEVTLLVLI